jgi:hypothetical protein
MKRVHAAFGAGIAAVEAAAPAINDPGRGQLQPNSSVAPVALQKRLPRQRLKRARRIIHLNLRQRSAGNKRLRRL